MHVRPYIHTHTRLHTHAHTHIGEESYSRVVRHSGSPLEPSPSQKTNDGGEVSVTFTPCDSAHPHSCSMMRS